MTTTQKNSAAIKVELSQRTAEGTVDLELLGLAVETSHYEGYETIPYSLGMSWIGDDTERFLELLQGEGVTVEDFFLPRLDPFYVVPSLLNNQQLLLAVADDRRMSFVREVFLAAGDVYDHWLAKALQMGITKADLAEMILEKLDRTAVELDHNVSNFMRHSFMENGAGRMWRNSNGYGFFEDTNTYWDVLTDDQLVEAMKIVATTAPNLLFCGRGFNEPFRTSEKLRVRLGDHKVNALLEFAAKNLQSLALVSLETLAELPMDVQLKLAHRLKVPFGQWVIQMALEMGGFNRGLTLLDEFKDGEVKGVKELYIWWRNLPRKNDPSSLHLEVEQRLRAELKAAGWLVGILKTETYKGKRQFCVIENRRRYVKDRYQTLYPNGGRSFPYDGDVVMFCPQNGRELVPGKVIAVTFYEVLKAKR